MTYAPQPGTAAFRILAWLESEGKTAERNSSQIANARDGVVVAVYSAAETDAIQRLLGART